MKEKSYVSVICEYNPFHFGHLFQLEQLKSRFESVVCIMSGNIVQRGSVAVADKYLRAEAALKSGADLVLELPLPWCCSSAKDFAAAGVHVASAIGSPYLAFGAENDLSDLLKLEDFISTENFSEDIKKLVDSDKNISYPKALRQLISEQFGDKFAEIVEKPNNILALEYLSAMKNKNIKPFAVKRNSEFSSSSSIRSSGDGIEMLGQLPQQSRAVFEKELGKDFPRDGSKLDSFFIGNLRSMAPENKIPENLYSSPDDLVKKLLSQSAKMSSVDELIAACTDKVYTKARVRRALISLVFGITAERVRAMPSYTCVLAADKNGREILRSAKKQGDIDIITKPVRAISASEKTGSSFLFAKNIEDIISLSAPKPVPSDVGKTPFVTGD